MIGRGDEHRIDILAVEDAAVIEMRISSADVLRPGESALVNVGDRHHLDVVRLAALDERVEMARAHAATADDRECDAVIRAGDCRVGQVGEGHRAGRCYG